MLTECESALVDLALLDGGEEDGHDGGEVDGKLLCVNAGDDGKEDVAALLELGRVGDGRRCERRAHEGLKVRAEHVLADRLGERADRVLRDSAKVELVSLLDEREEGGNALHRRLEVGGELGLGGVRGGSDGADDGALEVERGGLEEGEEGLHEAGDVGLDVVAENLEEAVEGDAGGALGLGLSDKLEDELSWEEIVSDCSSPIARKNKTHRQKGLVALGAVLLEHLAEASERGARRLPDDDFGVGQSTLDKRPEALEVRLDEEGAALDDDAERGDGRLAEVGVARGGESLDLGEERGEDLGRGEGRREGVDNAEGGAGGHVLVEVGGFGLGANGEEGADDGAGEVEGLDLGLLAVGRRGISGERRVQDGKSRTT